MGSRPKFRAVIFDYNGTLLDDATNFYELGLRRALARYGVHLPPRETLRNTFSRLGPQDFVELVSELYSLNITWEGDVEPLIGTLMDGVRSKLAKGARGVLARLAQGGVPTALISGLGADHFAEEIRRRKLDRYFVKTRGGLRFKTKTIAAFVRSLGLDARDVLFISDIQKDLFEAQKVGCFTVGITHGYGSMRSLEEADPDEIINSFAEFFSIGDFIGADGEPV